MICSESTIDVEIKFLRLIATSFQLSVVQTVITNRITKFNKIKQASVQKCLFIYIFLGWVELVRYLLSISHKL